MNCESYEGLIQQFHDGELEKSKEPLVFTHMSDCENCREFFKMLNSMSISIQTEVKVIPEDLDEKVFRKVRYAIDRKRNTLLFKRYPAIMAYALGIIIILMALYMFNSQMEYRYELGTALKQIKYQNEKIDLLMNTMPEVHVNSKLNNEIIVQTKM